MPTVSSDLSVIVFFTMDQIFSQISPQCPDALTGVPGNLFLTLLQALVNAQCSLKPPPLKNYAEEVIDMDIFDFIVVGAGSAGSVVANRLSENEKNSVLLLEAGEEPSATSHVPALLFSIQETEEAWKYEAEEQEYACQGLTNKRCKLYSGKALGGSSAINGMLYVRGYQYDYDRWAEMGNPGWSWDDVMYYFKKSEDNIEYPNNPTYHSTGGHLKLNNFDYDIPIKQVFLDAAEELGIPTVDDIQNGTDICFGTFQGTVHNGQRFGTYSAFLQTARDRSNLKVITGAYVTKVIIDPKTKTAHAVEVKVNNKIKRFRAKKEIILSAGALRTPQILLLSGVGPKEHLEELGIPVIQDLKVGENLQDHMMFLGLYAKVPEELIPEGNLVDDLYNYFMHRSGKLSTIGLTNFAGFINTVKDSSLPDVQFLHVAFQKNEMYLLPLFMKITGMSEEVKKPILESNKESALVMPWPILFRPKSIGYLRLNSSDPFDKPRMFSNYLKDPEDVETLLRGTKFAEELFKSNTFKKYNPEFVNINLPACKEHEFMSDEYWKCSIRSFSTTCYHYCGTAKMGPSSDPGAVVDARLRVHGIQKLRVVDNSIMPYLVSANTNAPAIMIGEKGADMIKEDWENVKDEL